MPGGSEGWCHPLYVPAGHAKPDRPRLILSVLTPIQCDVQITDLGGPACSAFYVAKLSQRACLENVGNVSDVELR